MSRLTQENIEHLSIAFGTVGSPTTEKEIILTLSFDQRQYVPREAQKVFYIALEEGYIKELKHGRYKPTKLLNKETIERVGKERIYKEQTQEHEDYLLEEQARLDEIDGINAEFNAEMFWEIEQAYYDNLDGGYQ